MDFKRLVAFFAISLAIFAGWEHFFPSPKPNPAQQAAQQQQQTAATAAAEAALAPATPITVTTDTVKAVIDEKSGDLRQMTLLKYKANGDENKAFTLFNDSKEYTYVAQSELLDAQGNNILKGINFTAAQKEYSLNGDKVEVRLSAPETNGLKIDKVYTFTKDSYLVNVRFDITNTSGKPANLSADYRIVRDHSEPEGQGYFTRSFVGPVVYTPEDKFRKVSFSDLDDDAKSGKNEAEYARKTQTGWLGMIEHHFMSTWILQPKGGQSVCAAGDCRIDIKRRNDNLYSTSVSVPLAAIQNGAKAETSINLYAGPQTTSVIANIADVSVPDGMSFIMGACGVPKNPVTQCAKGSSSVSFVKNSPVKRPMIILLAPTAIKTGADLLYEPMRKIRFSSKMPSKNMTSPCPKSPNIMPNKSVKKSATKGVGSIVP